jgi:hypothetical protein
MLAGALVVSPVRGQTAADRGSDDRVKAELRQLFQERNAAVAAHNRPALERIYAEEFVFIHGVSGITGRADQIAALLARTSQPPIPIPAFDDLHVYGDVAVLRLRSNTPPFLSTNIFTKKGDRWQIVQVQTTLLPPERKVASVDRTVLEQYIGKYEMSGGVHVTITLEAGELRMQAEQAEGRPKFHLVPASETQFFVEGGTVECTFYRDATGRVTHFLERRPTGQELRGNKVE